MPSRTWKVEQAFLEASDVTLITKCLESAELTPTTVSVRELGRYGDSGARLLLCSLAGGRPYVVKIHRRAKIKREHHALSGVRNYFTDSDGPTRLTLDGSRGALLYLYRGAESTTHISNSPVLCDRVYQIQKFSDRHIRQTFARIWERCANARGIATRHQFIMQRDYTWYTRKQAAEPILTSVYGRHHQKVNFNFIGADITNPILFIDNRCFGEAREGWIGPVHGDLHANNVMLDKHGGVFLIDFAWACPSRHVLVDYVLMECSLRFLLFPHHVNLEEQLKVDTLLLKQDGASRLIRWASGSPLEHYYRRLGIMLNHIRTEATQFCVRGGDAGFLEYLAAQFLVLFGQMSYKTFNRHVGARVLGLIARKLERDNFA